MKIFGVNSYNYMGNNKKANNNATVFSADNYQQDSVSFTGRYPKGYKKIEKAVKDTTKPIKRNIKNSVFGEFAIATQKEVENLHNNLKIVKNFFSQLETNPIKATQIRKGYEKLIVTKGKSGLTFKLDDTKSLQIIQGRNNKDLIRINITEDDKSTHYMLAGYNKAVSNLNQKNPQFIPPKLRYMTVEEIKNSPIKRYISLANKEVENFSKYLLSQGNNGKTTSNTAKMISTSNIISEYSTLDMMTIFNKNEIQKLPEQAKPIVSKTGKLLGFKMPLSDGAELLVTKKMSSDYGADLTYLSIKETTTDGVERYFAIDCTTSDFLKTRTGGKPVVTNNNVYSYTPSELKEKNIKNHFNRYMNEIIGASKSSENNHSEVTILNSKTASKPVDIDLEQIEDINISKQIEKEIASEKNTEKIKKETDLNPTKSVKNESEIIEQEQKKVNLKIEEPEIKKEPETVQHKAEEFSQNIAEKVAKLKEEAVAKATGDAKIFAETYFQTFIEQFQTNFNAKVADFTEKFQELFKTFVK